MAIFRPYSCISPALWIVNYCSPCCFSQLMALLWVAEWSLHSLPIFGFTLRPQFPLCIVGTEGYISHRVRYTHLHIRVCFYRLCFICYLFIFFSAPQQLWCPPWRLCCLPESHREERSQGNGSSLPFAEDFQPIWVQAAAQLQGKRWVLPVFLSAVLLKLLQCQWDLTAAWKLWYVLGSDC